MDNFFIVLENNAVANLLGILSECKFKRCSEQGNKAALNRVYRT